MVGVARWPGMLTILDARIRPPPGTPNPTNNRFGNSKDPLRSWGALASPRPPPFNPWGAAVEARRPWVVKAVVRSVRSGRVSNSSSSG